MRSRSATATEEWPGLADESAPPDASGSLDFSRDPRPNICSHDLVASLVITERLRDYLSDPINYS